MRSVLRAAPAVVLLGLVLMGCSGNGSNNPDTPPDRPAKDIQAWVTLRVPGMT
jgi:hypothetical protein